MLEFTPYKIRDREWGVVFNLDAHTSFDQHLRFDTRREAVSCAAALNRYYAEERAKTEAAA